MRTTIDLPDPLLRRLKSQAALEGSSLKAFVLSLIERGLEMPAAAPPQPGRSALPCIRTGQPLPAKDLSNAGLFQLLDEA